MRYLATSSKLVKKLATDFKRKSPTGPHGHQQRSKPLTRADTTVMLDGHGSAGATTLPIVFPPLLAIINIHENICRAGVFPLCPRRSSRSFLWTRSLCLPTTPLLDSAELLTGVTVLSDPQTSLGFSFSADFSFPPAAIDDPKTHLGVPK
jgi:hypothetical protein